MGARRAARARRRALRRRPPLGRASPSACAQQFHGGVRAGVATTPTLFADGERYSRANRSRATWTYTHPVTVPSDAQLMERLQDDATGEALRALYRTYAGELLGFALNALGERGAAEEIVQEVFTRAWRHADRYDPARGSVRTWLYQIARHAIIDMRRRASARPSLAPGRAAARDRQRRATRSSRRCSAGRSPPRSSG